jgi:hypothetical protein
VTAPLPLPIRVLVKGASTVGWASGMGGPAGDFTFPRAIEAELYRQGRPAEVRAITLPSETTRATLRNWEREVIGWSPDVIVLVYGHYETIHLFLPRWLERHARSLRSRPGRIRGLYRKHVVRPVWMSLARLQARLDTMIEPTLRRSRPKRVAADLQQLITHVRKIGSPLVFVFELQPPASKYQHWFPGMAARMREMNDELAGLVKRIDNPDVRYFRTSPLVDKYADGDLDVATPDGFHYTPYLHDMIGRDLARQILDWAKSQPHLAIPD